MCIRDSPGGREACIACDVEQMWVLAQHYRKPFLNICHAGICENIVPIWKGEFLIGILFIGQCVMEPEVTYSSVYSRIAGFHAEYDYFLNLFEKLPCVDRHKLISAGVLAFLSFENLLNRQNCCLPEEQPDIVELAKGHIEANYQNGLSLQEISHTLHVSPSYLSRKFRQVIGMTLTDYIIKVRMEQAKKLLIHSEIPIQHISMNVGFEDSNYFSRVFKRQMGQTPKAYRKMASVGTDTVAS